MKKGQKTVASAHQQKAEDPLKKRSADIAPIQFETEEQKLIRELQVHQIVMEMQTEELILAKEQTSLVADRYVKLYDLAPTSYFTLSGKGEIIELNLCGAQMLGKERSLLLSRLFCDFVKD